MTGAVPASPPPLPDALLVVEQVRLLLDRAAGIKVPVAALRSTARRLAGPEGAQRARLIRLFRLSGPEADALDCAVAVAVEPALGSRIAEVQGHPGRFLPTMVALRLIFGHGADPMPRSGSPLLTWHLVRLIATRSGEPPMIEADPAIVEWFFGLPSLGGLEGVLVTPAGSAEPLPEWDVASAAVRIRKVRERGAQTVRVMVSGADGSGRSGLAAAVARAAGMRPLQVVAAVEPPLTAEAAVRVQRLMLLMPESAPVWRGDPRLWPPAAMLAPLQFVTLDAGEDLPRIDGVVDLHLPVPPLSSDTRDRLAQALLPAAVAAAVSPLGAPRLSDLTDAATLGIGDAEAFRALLDQRTRERVKGLGQIVQTRFGWDDLILPAPVMGLLRAIEAEARARDALLADPERRRLFEGTAALTALFAGSPGTGKSMAGQVVAAALKLDLLVIDTGAISSKFIGDTAKHLTNAFEVAREANCAIMFEEADGLFARRVETDSVNARHANADTGHLLQLVESHRHLVMLSTNRRANIDPAFLRRLRFIVEFPLPDLPERIVLWNRMLVALGVPEEAVAALSAPVAAAHSLSAAQIKSASLTAAFQAGAEGKAISPDHLQVGIRREQAKDGRIGEIVPPGQAAALSARRALG